jgi:hypothetical protein
MRAGARAAAAHRLLTKRKRSPLRRRRRRARSFSLAPATWSPRRCAPMHNVQRPKRSAKPRYRGAFLRRPSRSFTRTKPRLASMRSRAVVAISRPRARRCTSPAASPGAPAPATPIALRLPARPHTARSEQGRASRTRTRRAASPVTRRALAPSSRSSATRKPLRRAWDAGRKTASGVSTVCALSSEPPATCARPPTP